MNPGTDFAAMLEQARAVLLNSHSLGRSASGRRRTGARSRARIDAESELAPRA